MKNYNKETRQTEKVKVKITCK